MKVNIFKSASVTGTTVPSSPRSRNSKNGKSIRGKISGPIPIPDDEFPMRNPGTGIATPVLEGRERQLYRDYAAESIVSVVRAEGARAQNRDSVVTPANGANGANDEPAAADTAQPSAIAVPRGSPQSRRRTNPVSSTLRHSVVSDSTHHTVSSKDKPHRKKSTLRGALGKLFGRRKKTESTSTVSPFVGQPQHRSDPSALNREAHKESESKRSASLPITEFDRALRSHSVGPNDLTAIEGARNSIHADFQWPSRRRAATATSQLFRSHDGELSGLTPRPASTHARGNPAHPSNLRDDPEQIGRAITSDMIRPKRRSRSLNGLKEVAAGSAGTGTRNQVRRRSDEIRYWRESYDPAYMSPLSSEHPPDRDDEGEGRDVSTDLSREHQETQQVPKTPPPQPFNFDTVAHLNALSGMKITQAASLETRVGDLEARMRRIEQVVAQLCDATPGFAVRAGQQPVSAAPPLVPSLSQSLRTTSTEPKTRGLSRAVSGEEHGPSIENAESLGSRDTDESFGDAPTFVGSTRLAAPSGSNRPTSDATIREAVSLPTIPRAAAAEKSLTTDHYSTLLALLDTERTSRRLLESQVRTLAQRLDSVLGEFGQPRETSVLLDPPPSARSFGNVSAFDHDDDSDEDEKAGHGARDTAHLVPEDSGIATESTMGGDDDDHSEAYEEAFETPSEERRHGYGAAFGEELREDEPPAQAQGVSKRKKAARTLSLGQLTLGKPRLSQAKAAI